MICAQQQENKAIFVESCKKKPMKRLTCRKCEGHGKMAILKGHASACPYNACECSLCTSVMNMRANALIRRFRHRKPDENHAILKTITSKNGNKRLRIVPRHIDDYNGRPVEYTTGNGYALMQNPTPEGSIASPTRSSSSSNASPVPLPTPPLILYSQQDYIQQLIQTSLLAQLIQLHSMNGTLPPMFMGYQQ